MSEEQENARVAPEENQQPDAERREVFNDTAIQEAELAAKGAQTTLPDEDSATANIKAEYARKEKDLQENLKKAQEERELLDKRLRDTQHKLHMLTADQKMKGKEPSIEEKPQPSFDDYVEDIIKKFEDSPSNAVKQMIRDFASDRDAMRRRYESQLNDLRESLSQEIFMSQPDNAKHLAMVEELNIARPDLANLTLKQKLELVKLMDAASGGKPKEHAADEDVSPMDRRLLTGTPHNAVKSNGLPTWVNSPDVAQKLPTGMFKSKRELADWLDSEKAIRMAREAVKEQRKNEY